MWRTVLVVAIAAFLIQKLSYGAWEITSPTSTDMKSQSMSVTGTGNGEGAACSLYLEVWRGGTMKNSGDGSWPGGLGMTWSGSVAPPTGGFGTGEGELKLWKAGEQGGAALDTQTFTFVSP